MSKQARYVVMGREDAAAAGVSVPGFSDGCDVCIVDTWATTPLSVAWGSDAEFKQMRGIAWIMNTAYDLGHVDGVTDALGGS